MLTVIVGGPLGGLVLYLYTKSIKSIGPRLTFRLSCLVCCIGFFLMNFFVHHLTGTLKTMTVVFFYAFREVYISLLSSQQWAFIGTTLDQSTSSYLISFSGFVSISSAIGGCSVSWLLSNGGIRTLLFVSLFGIIITWSISELSFSRNTKVTMIQAESKKIKPEANKINGNSVENYRSNFWIDSVELFRKHKILRLLLLEAISHQFCVNLFQFMFHKETLEISVKDNIRAFSIARLFSIVNILSSILQFFVLPFVLNNKTLPEFLKILPLIVAIPIYISLAFNINCNLFIFGVIKVIEYSFLHGASELIYMPLGAELNYLGKELVKFFGHKIGKTIATFAISFVVGQFNLSAQSQQFLGIAFIVLWGIILHKLANCLQQVEYNDTTKQSVNFPSMPQRRSTPLFELLEDSEDEVTTKEINEIIYAVGKSEDDEMAYTTDSMSFAGYFVGEGDSLDMENAEVFGDWPLDDVLNYEHDNNKDSTEIISKSKNKKVSIKLSTISSTPKYTASIFVSSWRFLLQTIKLICKYSVKPVRNATVAEVIYKKDRMKHD